MVYNGILMETIGISVMVSIGLLLFFFCRIVLKQQHTSDSTFAMRKFQQHPHSFRLPEALWVSF